LIYLSPAIEGADNARAAFLLTQIWISGISHPAHQYPASLVRHINIWISGIYHPAHQYMQHISSSKYSVFQDYIYAYNVLVLRPPYLNYPTSIDIPVSSNQRSG
jgi:hypothetical protein